ncbi:hypothetical protein FRB99_000648 [Tulasnella sp. 403]|nr:hypothetical protein FRB99_000648 [Tulasnella sp. 403]
MSRDKSDTRTSSKSSSNERRSTRSPERGSSKSSSKRTLSSDRKRSRTKAWTEDTVQAILDAAPSESARSVLLQNPTLMKAILRKLARHKDEDGNLDMALLKRILVENDDSSSFLKSAVREREERLQSEMLRSAEAEVKLRDAQTKVNALVAEKQRVHVDAIKAREEAKLIKLSLEAVTRDIHVRDEALRRLERDYDLLDAEAARIRTENKELKIKEAHAVGRAEGRAEGRNEGRNVGRKEGEDVGYTQGYDEGFNHGYRSLASRLLSKEDVGNTPGHTRDSSGDTMAPPVTEQFRQPPDTAVSGREFDRESRRSSGPRSSGLQPPTSAPPPTVLADPPRRAPDPRPIFPPEEESALPPIVPIPVYNAPSPRPHIVRNPMPDIVVPETTADGKFNLPPPHEWHKTPEPNPLEFAPSPQPSPKPEPKAFKPDLSRLSAHSMPAPVTFPIPEVAPAPIKSPRINGAPMARDYTGGSQGQNMSPGSTPLSDLAILQSVEEEEMEEPEPTLPPAGQSWRIPMSSTLSVIPEGSENDGTSPIVRKHSMSPVRRGPYDTSSVRTPMTNLSYVPAPADLSMKSGNGSGVIDLNDDMSIPNVLPISAMQDNRMRMPEPNPGQPRLMQLRQSQSQGNTGRITPQIPTGISYEAAPPPDFIPNIREDPPTPFVVPVHQVHQVQQARAMPEPRVIPDSRSSSRTENRRERKGKGKKGKETMPEPAPTPEIRIDPPSDKSEQYEQLPPSPYPDVRPEPVVNRPPQNPNHYLSPQRQPPPPIVDSDSDDSGIAEVHPPPFVPRTNTPMRPNPPFIPPPPVRNNPMPAPPVVMPVQAMHTGGSIVVPITTGGVVLEPPSDANVTTMIPPGTVIETPYEPASMSLSPSPSPVSPRAPSPVIPRMPSPAPVRPGSTVPGSVSGPPSVQGENISKFPNGKPKAFVPKDMPNPAYVNYGSLGRPGKTPLGRPNPGATYSLTSRTPRLRSDANPLPMGTPRPPSSQMLSASQSPLGSRSPLRSMSPLYPIHQTGGSWVPPLQVDSPNQPPFVPPETMIPPTTPQVQPTRMSQPPIIPRFPDPPPSVVLSTADSELVVPVIPSAPVAEPMIPQGTGSRPFIPQATGGSVNRPFIPQATGGSVNGPFVPQPTGGSTSAPFVPQATGGSTGAPFVPQTTGGSRGTPFVPTLSKAASTANAKNKRRPRPRKEGGGGLPRSMGLTGDQPHVIPIPEPEVQPEPQPIVVPVQIPEPEPEREPPVAKQTRPRSSRTKQEPTQKGILKKTFQAHPPSAAPVIPSERPPAVERVVPVERARPLRGTYEAAPPMSGYSTTTSAPIQPPYMTPTPLQPSRLPNHSADPWMNAPEDFYPPPFKTSANAIATPKTTYSDFKDFKTPRTIFEPISSEQSSIYNPSPRVGGEAVLSSTTPAQSYSPPPVVPQPQQQPVWGHHHQRGSSMSSSNAFVPPSVGGYYPRPQGGMPRPSSRDSQRSDGSGGARWERVPTYEERRRPHAQGGGDARARHTPSGKDIVKTPAVSVMSVTDEDDEPAKSVGRGGW